MTLRYILISFFIFWSAPLPAAQSATIEGIILSPNGPVANGTIQAFTNFKSLQRNKPVFSSKPGTQAGEYIMILPAGKYYFTAQGINAKRQKLYSYHGLNPITISSGDKWIPFFTLPFAKKECQGGFQGIGGRVTFGGEPVESGSVSVYSIEDEPFRGMGLLTNTLDDKGEFWFDLEPGQYMVIGRKRQDADAIGPLQSGDLFCYSAANPIDLRPAESCEIEMSCYPRNDISSFLLKEAIDPRGQQEIKRRHASLEGVTIEKNKTAVSNQSKLSIIAGRVTDTSGLPIPGLLVSAYPADELKLFQMYIVRFKSGFLAHTSSDGRFRLEVQAGNYYLVARERIGEAPASGEYYGLYEGNSNHSITVNAGETKTGVQILATPIMP